MNRLLILAVLFPSIAFGQVLRRDTGIGTFSGPVTAESFTATAGAGSNGYHQSTGAYLDLGDGPDDYLYSDGLLVHSAAPFDTPLGIISGGIVTRGLQSIVMAAPVNDTFTLGAGTLVAGTYCYRIVATTLAGPTTPSTETCLVIGAGDAPAGVNVNWTAILGAVAYKVYGRSTGAEQLMATLSNIPTISPTWLDNGSITPAGALPTVNDSGIVSAPSFTANVGGFTGLNLTTTAASGAAAISVVSGSKICLDATCTRYLAKTTSLIDGVSATSFNGLNVPAAVTGGGADGSTAVGLVVKNYTTLSTAGSKIATFAPDNANTVKASIDKDGMLQFGVGNTGAAPTCDATQRGKIWLVNGGSGVTDTVTICLKAAADTYSWITLTTGG